MEIVGVSIACEWLSLHSHGASSQLEERGRDYQPRLPTGSSTWKLLHKKETIKCVVNVSSTILTYKSHPACQSAHRSSAKETVCHHVISDTQKRLAVKVAADYKHSAVMITIITILQSTTFHNDQLDTTSDHHGGDQQYHRPWIISQIERPQGGHKSSSIHN